jgi:hypothetical protein
MAPPRRVVFIRHFNFTLKPSAKSSLNCDLVLERRSVVSELLTIEWLRTEAFPARQSRVIKVPV